MDGKDWQAVGCQLFISGQYHAAVACLERARPSFEDNSEYHRQLGNALWFTGDRTNALKELKAGWELDQTNFGIAANFGTFFHSMGAEDGALHWMSKAVELQPDDIDARWNLATFLLTIGDWARGWKEYDIRYRYMPMHFPTLPMPLWEGQSLKGKLIWVTSEQGIGDQIMFMRYLPWLQKQGASVIFDSHAELVDFSFAGGVPTRGTGHAGKWKVPLHPVTNKAPDYHCPLMSLPARHGTTQETVPEVPGWFKEAALPFKVALPGAKGKKKIGLCWAGSSAHAGDSLRSMNLNSLLPLTANDDVEFFSFQVGGGADDIKKAGADALIHRIALQSWMMTAAALKEMDALVTVDTAVAHLSASLGVKTYMLISTVPDFRWGLRGGVTPWYKSMTIFRQEIAGDWTAPVQHVKAAIAQLCAPTQKAAPSLTVVRSGLPRVAFFIPCRDKMQWVARAAQTAFAQETAAPLEIVLSDQGSTDGSLDVLRSVATGYDGPHKVHVVECPETALRGMAGLNAHINWLHRNCDYDVAVIASADDYSLPGRVQRTAETFAVYDPDVVAAGQRMENVDGSLVGVSAFPDRNSRFATPAENIIHQVGSTGATTWTRRLFEELGCLRNVESSDIVPGFLATHRKGLFFLNEVLSTYVYHASLANTGMEGVVRAARDERERAQLTEVNTYHVVSNYTNLLQRAQQHGLNLDSDTLAALFERIANLANSWARARDLLTMERIPPERMNIGTAA